MSKPIISIVVPVYNVDKCLRRCLDSVIAQSYLNIEIIVVDDGSTDNSSLICDEYKSRDNRIIVIHQENRGLSAARNAGIDIAKGKYVCFIDSDDYVSSNYVSILLAAVEGEMSQVAICNFVKGSDKNFIFKDQEKMCIEKTVSAVEFLTDWHNQNKDVETMAWNKIYLTSLFDKEIRYPEGKCFEDISTTHKVLSKATKVTLVDNKLYYYYQREGSIKNNISDKKILDEIEMIEERADWFKANNYEGAYARLLSKNIKYLMIFYVRTKSDEMKKKILLKIKTISSIERIKRDDKILIFLFFKSLKLLDFGVNLRNKFKK